MLQLAILCQVLQNIGVVYAVQELVFIPDIYLSLNGDIIPNHGYVVITDIGSTDNTALVYHTNRPPPYNGRDHSGGDWFAPDWTIVSGQYVNDQGFKRNRGPMVVRLLRYTANDPPAEGIYHCLVPDTYEILRIFSVGLYFSGRGMLTSQNSVYHQFYQVISPFLGR